MTRRPRNSVWQQARTYSAQQEMVEQYCNMQMSEATPVPEPKHTRHACYLAPRHGIVHRCVCGLEFLVELHYDHAPTPSDTPLYRRA